MLCHRLALDSRRESGLVPSLADSAPVSLDPGACVFFRDVQYHVVSRDAQQVVLTINAESSHGAPTPPVVIPLDSVTVLLNSGDLRAVPPQPRDLVAQRSRRLLASATQSERARALRRWSAVCHYRSSGTHPPDVSRSAVFQYLRWAREAAQLYGSDFLGMFRPRGSRGRRRITAEQLAVLRDVAEAFHRGKYTTRIDNSGSELPLPSRRRFPAAYSDYRRLSRERDLEPRSSRMLRRQIAAYSTEKSELARRGSRAAYPYSAPRGRLTDTLPVHGSRAFEVGHVDHQLLDVCCISGATGAVLGRPWLTLVFDAFSRMPLGFVLRYDPPCVFSVLCAMFDCVVRHVRFPDALVSDQGSEFESPDLSVALAHLRSAPVRRPPTKPRYGALIERQFGSLKTRVVDELSGSIDTVARSRELTSTHDPERLAVWTLPSLSKLIEKYFFEHYPKLVHSELGAAPGEVFEFSLAQAGERAARRVAVDDTLSLAFSETVAGSNGCRTVPKRGGSIRVGHLDFHHPDFSDGRVAGRAIPVRRCSADASFVYVLFPHRGGWERAQLVTGSVDLTQCSWRQSRALLEERAWQRVIAALPAVESANAAVMEGFLVATDEYERKALARRRAVDDEQKLESAARAGVEVGLSRDADVAASELAEPPRPAESGDESLSPVSTWVRSYDEDPD